jgi:hypothetical protein
VIARRDKRTLEVVEHRQQLLDQPLRGARDQIALIARDPLAVVLELGLETLERVEILVALLANPVELSRGNLPVPPYLLHLSAIADARSARLEFIDLALLLDAIVGHYVVFASSSTTS